MDLLVLGHLAFEYGTHDLLLGLAQGHLERFVFLDELVDHVAVHAHEAGVLVFRLVPIDIVVVELSVHNQHVITFGLGRFEERIFLYGIVHIEENDRTVLVGLVAFDDLLVLFGGEILAFGRLPQHETLCLLGELFVGDNAVFDEDLQIVPFLFVVRTHRREELLQAIGHLAGDVVRNLLDVRIALQVAARYVQRNIRRVDHAVQQGEVFRYDPLDLVGHIHLIGVELDLVFLNFEVVPNLREVEDTRQVERIIDIQMNREERLFTYGIEFVVELLVLLGGDLGGFYGPQRGDVVDDVVLVGIDVFAVFPLLHLAESDGNGQEATVLAQQFFDLRIFAVFERIGRKVQYDRGPPVALLGRFLHFVFGRSFATPMYRLGALLVGAGENLHFVSDHESGVESQSEVADNRLVLVFLHELLGARKGDLVNIALHLVGSHADASVGDRQGFGILVRRNADRQVAQVAFYVAHRGQGLEFLRGVHGVGDQLTQEDFVVRIEELFDNGEDILGGNPDFSVFHRIMVFF